MEGRDLDLFWYLKRCGHKSILLIIRVVLVSYFAQKNHIHSLKLVVQRRDNGTQLVKVMFVWALTLLWTYDLKRTWHKLKVLSLAMRVAYGIITFAHWASLANLGVKCLLYGMSELLIPCLSDAALPQFMALCIWLQDVEAPSQEGFQL